MKDQIHVHALSEGVRLVYIETDRFKTSSVSISLAVPLSEETASANAILPYLLKRSCKAYPTNLALQTQLAQLYGAGVGAGVEKMGEAQMVRMTVNAVADRFALEGETISKSCAELLRSLLFEPNFDENGAFRAEDIEREKRILIDKIEGQKNEKRVYAIHRLEEEMFKGEPYALNALGTVEQVEALTEEQIRTAWNTLLKTAKVQINVIGSWDIEQVCNGFRESFAACGRETVCDLQTSIHDEVSEVREINEEMPLNQGKLVLGYRVAMKDKYVCRVMADLFGGGTYSLLFKNVREKHSLCYYCGARYNRVKSIMLVQSGIENKNRDLAVTEIGKQLETVKNNEFSQEDFDACITSLADSYQGVEDAPWELDVWFTSQFFEENLISTEDYVANLRAVSREQIAEAAASVKLDTIFTLVATEEEVEDDA